MRRALVASAFVIYLINCVPLEPLVFVSSPNMEVFGCAQGKIPRCWSPNEMVHRRFLLSVSKLSSGVMVLAILELLVTVDAI